MTITSLDYFTIKSMVTGHLQTKTSTKGKEIDRGVGVDIVSLFFGEERLAETNQTVNKGLFDMLFEVGVEFH